MGDSFIAIYGCGIFTGIVMTLIICCLIKHEDERVNKRQFNDHSNLDIYSNVGDSNSDSDVGNAHKPINSGQDMGMGTEEIINVLSTMRVGACQRENEVLDKMIRLVLKLEEIFMDESGFEE